MVAEHSPPCRIRPTPDLDQQADLASNRQEAELFAEVRLNRTPIARDQTPKLRDDSILNHVIGFVRDRIPDPGPATGRFV